MAGPTAIFSYILIQILMNNFISSVYSPLVSILLNLIIPMLLSIVVFYIIIPKELLETLIVFISIIAFYSLFDVRKSVYIATLKNDYIINKILIILICWIFIILIGLNIDTKDRI